VPDEPAVAAIAVVEGESWRYYEDVVAIASSGLVVVEP